MAPHMCRVASSNVLEGRTEFEYGAVIGFQLSGSSIRMAKAYHNNVIARQHVVRRGTLATWMGAPR